MAKKPYKFIGSILVKKDNKNTRFQLADASDFGKNALDYRVYYNRRWLDGFYTEAGLLFLIRDFCFEKREEKPDFRRSDIVRVYFDDCFENEGFLNCATGSIIADPILAYTGQWVCPVLYNYKVEYMDCRDLQLIRRVRRKGMDSTP